MPTKPALAPSARAVILAALMLASCSTSPTSPPPTDTTGTPAAGQRTGFGDFPDIALPSGTSIDLDRSLVLGTGREWVGRLAFTARGGVAETYDYFRMEMPRLGWTEVSSLRAATSLLVFQQGPRIATIQLAGRSFALGGVAVELVMAPRGTGDAVPARGRGGIDQAPLPAPRL
jgi:hypothetical protein